jgi:SAM-dependent methyltransferase
MNKWKTIWNNRTTEKLIPHGSTEEVFLRLKSLMNVSSSTEIEFSSYKDQFEANLAKMRVSCAGEPQSFFEVGCGSGMYLYYLGVQNKGFTLGGVDYSAPLIEAAGKVLRYPNVSAQIEELYCAEGN